ncbi:MAG: hypothetical protein WBQ08_24540 [Candidatus Sulfotelmatobacter sp.]
MRRLARVVFAVLLTVPAVAGQKKPTILPFTTNSDGLVIVSVALGGEIHADVALDTGAGLDGRR